MTDQLLVDTDGRGVTTLTLNRPERHNAFDDKLINTLLATLQQIEQDPAARVVVLTGAGKSFSSGADLAWMRAMASYDEKTNREDAQRLARLMEVLNNLAKPVVARVNGSAYGGADPPRRYSRVESSLTALLGDSTCRMPFCAVGPVFDE